MGSTAREGELDFDCPEAGKPCKTWYRVCGDISSDSGKTPVVLLHGGPGFSPLYISPLEDLFSKYGIPVVFYNQIGSWRSTHLPERMGDVDFWTEELFIKELDNVIEQLGLRSGFDLYGQSWGGMLAAAYATLKPEGLRKLVISNSPATMDYWVEGCGQLLKLLPEDVQEIILRHEAAGTTDTEEYKTACLDFYRRNTCRVCDPFPQDFLDDLDQVEKDPTVYHTMNGPSEFHVTGSLRGWSIIPRLSKIQVPTLVINGRYDMARDFSVKPYLDNIRGSKWIRYEESSHMPHFEERTKYMKDISEFLKS